MAGSKKRRKTPALLALLISDGLLMSPDKVVTLYRLVDTFNFGFDVVSAEGQVVDSDQSPPSDGVPMGFVLECNVLTKWGPGEGEFVEELRVLSPDGKESSSVKFNFTKPAGVHMQQINHQIKMLVRRGGTHVLRAYLNGKLKGEHPFIVNINVPPSGEGS